jgi:hypothetical protein
MDIFDRFKWVKLNDFALRQEKPCLNEKETKQREQKGVQRGFRIKPARRKNKPVITRQGFWGSIESLVLIFSARRKNVSW